MKTVNREHIDLIAGSSTKPENAILRNSALKHVPDDMSSDFYEGMLTACEIIVGILAMGRSKEINQTCIAAIGGIAAEKYKEAFPAEIEASEAENQ